MTEVSPERIDLRESKRRYAGTLINRFQVVPDGTLHSMAAEIDLKGAAARRRTGIVASARRLTAVGRP